MFLPTTKTELEKLGWNQLDIIIVSGDAYIDSSFDGAALIGKWLLSFGYKVGIIAQPDINSEKDITRLGEPTLFWGITSGCVDSMVANYTATKKKRKTDDFTPGGINNRRPDRAAIVYTNLIKKYFKNTKPIILGGIEASLRRIAHYDYWDDKIRRSILFDSKADYLVYGMAEKSILQIADNLKSSKDIKNIRGICYISNQPVKNYIELPSFEDVANDKKKFVEMFHLFYRNNDPLTAKGIIQKHNDRYLIQNPPAHPPDTEELDKIYELDFERDVHPFYKKMGKVKALETIKFSITSHRGCFGECNFCSITVHQGEHIISRSEQSIIKEAILLTSHPDFKGYIHDVGGPTANMYGMKCKYKKHTGLCFYKNCAFPEPCAQLDIDHEPQLRLLEKLRKLKGVKKIFISSGIRYDLIIEDKKSGDEYISVLARHHTSGQIKVAPEHSEGNVLKMMRKPSIKYLEKFRNKFQQESKKAGKKQYLTYYLIAAHPGCGEKEMKKLRSFIKSKLKINPEQVQIFTPLPSTYSALMYYTETDPFTNKKIFVEKHLKNKQLQKEIII